MTDEQFLSPQEANPKPAPGDDNRTNYAPVTIAVTETGGAVFLTIISILLLVALLRALARNRELAVKLAQQLPAARVRGAIAE